MKKIFNEIMKNAISLWIIYKFSDMGNKIYEHGQSFTKVQADTLEYWISWFACGFLVVIFTWFPSAVPFLKDVVSNLVSLRSGRQDAPLPLLQPLPAPPMPITPISTPTPPVEEPPINPHTFQPLPKS